jgi:membrane protease YdiL (CAAX protease family)
MKLASWAVMAAWLLVTVWCLLLLGGLAAPWLGTTAARLGAFLACAALLVAMRPPGRERVPLLAVFFAGASGWVALPAWLGLIFVVGSALGLPRVTPAPLVASPDAWIANVVLAPLFEELLYRERLLPALRQRIGKPLALVTSSALFAAPHLEPWSVLAAFAAGLVLGGLFLVRGSVVLCVAYHAGLNGAVLFGGLPPARAALDPLLAACAAALLIALACTWRQGRPERPHFRTLACASSRQAARGLLRRRAWRRTSNAS